MIEINKLKVAIERSEYAYTLYLNERKFFQAIRIRNANVYLYTLLENLLLQIDFKKRYLLYNFLFHLDDWFIQFEESWTSNSPALDDVFVFERKIGMFPYPKDFINELLK